MKRIATLLIVVAVLTSFVAACAVPTPEVVEKQVVVEKPVVQTVVVEKEKIVEKPVVQTVVVEKEVTKIVEVKPTKHGGTLRAAIGANPSTLNPYGGASGMSGMVFKSCLESLVELDKETLKPVPLLATGWEIPDEQTYVFTLRKGVKFHDGTDFNAHAVKFAFDYIVNPDNAVPIASRFDRVESVEIVDDYKVVFHLKEPFGVLLDVLAADFLLISPMYLQQATPGELDEMPMGTGPFKVVKWTRDEKVEVERFEDYWGEDLPYLDAIEYKILPDTTVKMIALRTGEVDIVDTVPVTEIKAVKEDKELDFVEFESTGYRSIYLNCAAPPFDDVRLRQVLAWAVDRGELIRLGSLGLGTPANGPLAPPQWAFDPNFKPYMRDIEKVKELLTEAGVPEGFSFILKCANSPDEVRMAEALQQQFAEAGIKAEILTGEYTAIRSTVTAGDYDAWYVGWGGGTDPDRNMWNSFHSDGWFNWVNYNNPEVDRLLDEARSISDIERRAELYREAQRIISDEAPMVFIKFPYYAADGQGRRIYVMDFVPGPGSMVMDFKKVWLAPR